MKLDPALDLEELSKHAHSFGEVVGLGLRDLAHCPVELNLMPKSSIQRQEFAQKKPYLIAAIFCLALAVFLLHQAEAKLIKARADRSANVKQEVTKLTKTGQQLKDAINQRDAALAQAQGVSQIADSHFYWMKLLTELRSVMLNAEATSKATLKTKTGGQDIDTGIWVESFEPELPEHSPYESTGTMNSDIIPRAPRAGAGGRPLPGRAGQPGQPGTPVRTVRRPSSLTNNTGDSISNILITCRLIDRKKFSASANQDMAFSVKDLLNASPWFTNAHLWDQGVLPDSSDTNTMLFQIDVGLKRPFKL